MSEHILNITLEDLFEIFKDTGVQVTVDISNLHTDYGIKFTLKYEGYVQDEPYLLNLCRQQRIDKEYVLDHIRQMAKFLVAYVKKNKESGDDHEVFNKSMGDS